MTAEVYQFHTQIVYKYNSAEDAHALHRADSLIKYGDMTEKERQELHRLYPELSDEQLEEAHETLMRYATLLVRMVERRNIERKEANRENGMN